MRRFGFYDKFGDEYGKPETNWQVFYQIFEPNYFIPDNVEHVWRAKYYVSGELLIEVWTHLSITP